MSTASAAQQAAWQYITGNLSGTVADRRFVGMTATPDGRRVGYEVTWDRGTSVVGAVLGALFVGLFALLVALLVGLLLALVGFPPGVLVVLGLAVTAGGLVTGGRAGADASEVERVTVTVDDAGDVVMVNRDLSAGEFSRAIDRQYDRVDSQVSDFVHEVSRQWLLHKVFDRYLDSRRND